MVLKLNKLVEQNSESKDMVEEVSKWQDKITCQSNTAESLREEITHLRKEIRLVRLKSKLIR